MSIRVREATVHDAPVIVKMAKDLTIFEKLPDSTFTTEHCLKYGFGEKRLFHTLLAEKGNIICGYAMWYPGFTTDNGTPGMHLLDLYVNDSARGTGAGKLLMKALAEECEKHGLLWMTWYVVKNNESAARFYNGLGFKPTTRVTYYADQATLEKFLQQQRSRL